MSKAVKSRGKVSSHGCTLFLDELREGFTGTVVVMICRSWDVNSVNSRYMSTDYVVSDKKGNFMHCVAKSHVAHLFVEKLKEGVVFSIRGFDVVKKKNYMLWEDMPYVIELQGDTLIRKVNDDVSSFVRHPFKFTKFEDLKPTENKHFVDVVRYITSIGEQSTKSNGAQTVEFNLCNERKRAVKVTLWGELGEVLFKNKVNHPGAYFVILTSMSAKYYLNNLCLSSTSCTFLIDSDDVPDLNAFKSSVSGGVVGEYTEPITEDAPLVYTLRELVERSRQSNSKKHTVIFQNTVEIIDIRTRTGWFIYTCSGKKCRKGLEREGGCFKCKGCQVKVDYPRTKYRLQLEVDDGTMRTIVVLFDEIAKKLIGRTAKSLVDEQMEDNSSESSSLPPVIEALIGTKHVFEIKSHTYYQFGEYESFNCSKNLSLLLDGVGGASSSENIKTGQNSTLNVLKRSDPISTPALLPERKKLRLSHIDEYDSEDLADHDGDNSSSVEKLSAKRRLFKECAFQGEDAYNSHERDGSQVEEPYLQDLEDDNVEDETNDDNGYGNEYESQDIKNSD